MKESIEFHEVVGYGWGPALCAAELRSIDCANQLHSAVFALIHLIDAPRERISWGEEAETERLKILKWNGGERRKVMNGINLLVK